MRWAASFVIVLVFQSALVADESADALAKKVEACLAGAGFLPLEGAPGRFTSTVTRGLETCTGIDLEVRVRDGVSLEILAFPRLHYGRIDPQAATDAHGLAARLGAPPGSTAPFAWSAEGTLHACATIAWDDETGPPAVADALALVPALDRDVADLLGFFPPPPSAEELAASLREAGAADEARRTEILASLAPYLPELTPSATPGQSSFVRLVLNGSGTAFDAFRFRVPEGPDERRLVWAFAYPPGTAKGWYIAPVGVEAPKLVKFHKGGRYEGTGVPEGHATLLQRSETPLRSGAQYVLWFQFKVDTPVDLYVALGCYPFDRADRDTPAAVEAALGLAPAR